MCPPQVIYMRPPFLPAEFYATELHPSDLAPPSACGCYGNCSYATDSTTAPNRNKPSCLTPTVYKHHDEMHNRCNSCILPWKCVTSHSTDQDRSPADGRIHRTSIHLCSCRRISYLIGCNAFITARSFFFQIHAEL
jgi:hypothetical protein